MGEPLSHPDVGLFLDMCEEHGFKVNIVTSGAPLPSRGEAILGKPALKQVSVSLHSALSDGNGLALGVYLDSVLAFARKARNQPGLKVSLRLWDKGSDDNPGQRSVLLKELEERLGSKPFLEGLLTHSDSVKLSDSLHLNAAPRFEWPDMRGADHGEKGSCHGLRDQFAILVDGTVVPCCLDRDGVISLGNVKERPLKDILANERAVRIRKGFQNGVVVEELCRRCSYRLRFNH